MLDYNVRNMFFCCYMYLYTTIAPRKCCWRRLSLVLCRFLVWLWNFFCYLITRHKRQGNVTHQRETTWVTYQTWDNLSYQWNIPIIKSNDFWWEMGKEVSIRTTVVPIILAIRTTVVPIIFAIRKTVDRTIPGRWENSNWYLQSICYTRL